MEKKYRTLCLKKKCAHKNVRERNKIWKYIRDRKRVNFLIDYYFASRLVLLILYLLVYPRGFIILFEGTYGCNFKKSRENICAAYKLQSLIFTVFSEELSKCFLSYENFRSALSLRVPNSALRVSWLRFRPTSMIRRYRKIFYYRLIGYERESIIVSNIHPSSSDFVWKIDTNETSSRGKFQIGY